MTTDRPGAVPPGLAALIATVQANCHIADARGAGDLTMCVYLLQMREFYRWEHGLAALQPLTRDHVARWLSERESLWESLEDRDFAPLLLEGQTFQPFDVTGVNAQLLPLGWVYGAGHVAAGRASFFLGRLERVDRRGELEVLVSGVEHARCLLAPPAALQGSTVWLRRQALQRWLWEKYEAWSLRRHDNAFKAALDGHGFAGDGTAALVRMVDAEAESLLLHETGEFEAGQRLGSDWQALRETLTSRRTDLYVRATRDHLADCLVTLPTLLQRGSDAALHFWFANFEGVRELLFPRLWPAYFAWCGGDGGAALLAATAAGATHWQEACHRLLAIHRAQGAGAPPLIEQCVQSPGWALR